MIPMGSEFREYVGKHHYTWALRSVVQFAQQWRIENQVQAPHEWVFDWMEPNSSERIEAEQVMHQAEAMAKIKRGVTGDYTNVSFRSRRTLAGLQCADLVAWTNFQKAWEVFNKRPSPPFAKIAWDDFESKRGREMAWCNGLADWNMSLVVQRQHLHDWRLKEEADGEAIRRFRDWKSGSLSS